VLGAAGHPGNNPQQAAIARWTCGAKATVDMKSLFKHPTAQGDGVRVRIVSSKAGLLQEWTVAPGQSQELRVPAREVAVGEHWYFLVDPNTEGTCDSYEWDPNIRELPTKRVINSPSKPPVAAKPSMSPLAMLAQSLLCANEFTFVD
jgi:hypothetical protein